MVVDGPAAVGVFDDRIRHVMVSPHLARMNGCPAEDLLGRTPVEVHGSSVSDAQQTYQQVLDTGEPIVGRRFSAAIPATPDRLRHWVLDCFPLPPGGPRGVVVTVTEITEWLEVEMARGAALERLRNQAERDMLTGLWNRTGLDNWFEHRRIATREYDVVYIDLDRFKEVNDRAGHMFGDGVLADIARRLEAVLAEHEMIARVGGDEFVAITTGDGHDLARRLQGAADHLVLADRRSVHVAASCGVATLQPSEPLDAAVSRADAEMYARKRAAVVPTQAPTPDH